jgi:hypothetical protein
MYQKRPNKLLRDRIFSIRLNKAQLIRLHKIAQERKTPPSVLVRSLIIDLFKEANSTTN